MFKTTMSLSGIALGSFILLPACTNDTSDPSETGSLALHLEEVPADARCLEVEVNGSRSVSRLIDLADYDDSDIELDLLPIGQVSVEGRAFEEACNAVFSDTTPSYATEKPVFAEIEPGKITNVQLHLLRNGRLGVFPEFEGPAACRPQADLTALAFNIRYDGGPFGSNAWERADNPRRDRVATVMQDSGAQLIGVQEALDNQVDDLTEALPEYAFFGVGRDDGQRDGEFSGIFYLEERFEFIEGGNFWLSETPEVPGTVFEGSGSIRIATWVRLLDLSANRTFLFLNTHWDNVSQSSREKSGLLIRERIAELDQGGPVILTGDLNVTETNPAILGLLSGPLEEAPDLLDLYRVVHPEQADEERTFHGFQGTTVGERIDYVLSNDDFVPQESTIVRTNFDGFYPSDHYPVSAKLSWADDGAGTACFE